MNEKQIRKLFEEKFETRCKEINKHPSGFVVKLCTAGITTITNDRINEILSETGFSSFEMTISTITISIDIF